MKMPTTEIKAQASYKYLKKCDLIGKFTMKAKANKVVSTMIAHLKDAGALPFNCELPEDGLLCYRSLIVHRATTKFALPSKKKALRHAAFKTYLDYERDLMQDYFEKGLAHDFLDRPGMRNTAKLLQSWLRNFDIWNVLRTAPIRFSPGETFVAAKGETSVIAKIRDLDHWTVSNENLEYAVYLIYHCRGLKLAAKQHLNDIAKKRPVPELSREGRAKLFQKFKEKATVRFPVGYLVFKHILTKYILLITNGARGSSVAKNEKTDRFINVEPFFNVLIQAAIEIYIRRLLRVRGNDIGIQRSEFVFKGERWIRDPQFVASSQHLHGKLIACSSQCTIDLKNASDSTLMYILYKLVPDFAHVVELTRSRVITLDETAIEPFKVSSMGNGYTFGLMTLILYASGVANNIPLRVYGDDIIVANYMAYDYIQILESLEYKINYEKSFINHPFRESCGYFYHDDLGYLLSFDIHAIESRADLVVTTNKVRLLAEECKKVGFDDLWTIFMEAWKGLLPFTPALQRGPYPVSAYVAYQNLGLFVFDEDYLYKQKRKVGLGLRDQIHRLMSLANTHFEGTGHYKHCASDLTVVCINKFVGQRTEKYEVTGKLHELLQFTGSHHGEIRGQGNWTTEVALTGPTGCIFRLDQLLAISDEGIESLAKDRYERRPHTKAPLAKLA